MVGVAEVAGYAIVGGALVHVASGLAAAFQRRSREAELARESIRLFRRRAGYFLDTALAEREKSEHSWNGLRKFRIDRKVMEAEDVCSFYLRLHDDKELPPFQPGQYLTFQLRIPGQEKPVIRCYSLSDSPTHRDYYRVTIKRLGPPPKEPTAPPGLSSSFFHEALQEGDILDVKAPSGHFFLDTSADRPVVLIGGGVGLTPVLSMLNWICESGRKYETWFFYGIRNRAEHAMYDHLNEIAANYENVNIRIFYSDPAEDAVEGRDYHVGERFSIARVREMLPSNNYEFYICGPPPMMQSVTKDLAEWGVPDENVHFEAFGPASVKKAAPPPDAAAAGAGEAVEVVFERSGKTCNWKADSGSLLELAEANGVALDFGCRAGNCGTCVTAVREGKVSYMSEPGVPPDEGSCLACMAVPSERLVLDA